MNNKRARTRRASRGLPKALFATWRSASVGGLDLFADRRTVPFKRLLEESLQQVLEGQNTDFLDAALGKRNRTRSTRRDGHRNRKLVTAMGEPRVPRERAQQSSGELFDRYHRAEKTVLSALATLHLRGVSVASVRNLIETLGGRSLSQGATVQVATGVRAALARFADRPTETDTTRLILRACRTQIRLDGIVRAKTILIATGIDSAGRREVLDVELADRASMAVSKGVLRRLRKHGPRGVEVIVRSDRDGPMPALHIRLGLRSGSALQRSCRGGRTALLSSHPAERLAGATDLVGSPVPGSSSKFVEPQAAVKSVDRSPAALPPPAPGVGSAHNAPMPGTAVPLAGADREAPALEDQPSVIWVRRGVEKELGVRQTKPSAGGKQNPAWLLAGFSLGLFALATGSWVVLHSVGTSQEASAAAPASAPEVPRSEVFATASLPAGSPLLRAQSEPRSSRLRLTGVIASKTADGPGIALISIGDGTPSPFRVGTLVDDDFVLKTVTLNRAELGPVNGSATLVLELTTAAPVVAADHSRGSLASAAPQPLGAVPSVGSARASNGDGDPDGMVDDDSVASKAVVGLSAQKAREARYSAAATRAAARRARIRNQRAMP